MSTAPIVLGDDKPEYNAIVKRSAIGQVSKGAVVKTEWRNQREKDPTGQWVTKKPKANGKIPQELWVTVVAMPGHTAPSGSLEKPESVVEGQVVELIFSGFEAKQWLDIKKQEPVWVGDVVTRSLVSAQRYEGPGSPVGPVLNTQDEVNTAPRVGTIGYNSTLTKRRATPDEQRWVDMAVDAFHQATAVLVPEDDRFANGLI